MALSAVQLLHSHGIAHGNISRSTLGAINGGPVTFISFTAASSYDRRFNQSQKIVEMPSQPETAATSLTALMAADW
jgi:hypothetical protein